MERKTSELNEQEMKNVNGGDGIVAYDPVTGNPFPEETGGYPKDDRDDAYNAGRSKDPGNGGL